MVEVCARRAGGHHVKFVSCLKKALEKYGKLGEMQALFLNQIEKDVDSMLDPEYAVSFV